MYVLLLWPAGTYQDKTQTTYYLLPLKRLIFFTDGVLDYYIADNIAHSGQFWPTHVDFWLFLLPFRSHACMHEMHVDNLSHALKILIVCTYVL